ncbi:hypothetical protein PENVUL_c008G08073 [Penicillium vulpinum]|uniref:Uncharacterized protein n=1 Tax=Penicillium vulpinum TaxID=29845 RepID=A0A1V6S422_9EURO|nr:hypothetical protein PENVUL_c008G08073 [Penicillium vulpinum]
MAILHNQQPTSNNTLNQIGRCISNGSMIGSHHTHDIMHAVLWAPERICQVMLVDAVGSAAISIG